MANLSAAQIKTLKTMIANGGEMNGYAGQQGFDCRSLRPLTRMGLIEDVEMCAGCAIWIVDGTDTPCVHGGSRCYNRVRVTDAGRTAVAPEAASATASVTPHGTHTRSHVPGDHHRSIAPDAYTRTAVWLGERRDV